MLLRHLSILAVSLPLAACVIDKGNDDSSTTAATDTATDTATSDEPTGTASNSSSADDTGATTGETGLPNNPCIDTPTVLAVDEPSPLGFSAAELLAGKLGQRSTTLTFAGEPTTLSDDLKNKQLPLTLDLRHEGGEVRFIDAEPNPDYDDSGNESGLGGECTDRLEVDVEIDFVTAAKEFDEHRQATLTATTVERADLRLELAPPGLMGSLDPTTVYSDPAWVLTALELDGIWQGSAAGGSVLNEVHVGGDNGTVGFGPLAAWGDPIGL
ncbi:MAG: hypothetical protein IPO88_26670 [Nannocystis sp.]|uniref:hypothetical protein n=1 Tax=Nannocystis sp. TaxID=1962667 RepID=UPI00242A2616|nr:hypothetical protein [Nannocystis sp.]MBK9757013.1 hypothetical protein [Nannocystis sp.]